MLHFVTHGPYLSGLEMVSWQIAIQIFITYFEKF